MFKTILIANRGEIALRILRTAQRMNIRTVAIYSEADSQAPHVYQADEAICVGPPSVAESYLNQEKILQAALQCGAEAIHPGYGLLSESAEFAQACANRGIVFIGPRVEHLQQFGLKHAARELALASAVPLVPGTDLLGSLQTAKQEAEKIGFPVMMKSTAGGGGIGMEVCRSMDDLDASFDRVQRLGQSNFGQGGIFLEKYVERARHLEVQIFGDGKGNAVSLGVRDCSSQRRNQKVIEETPACGVPESVINGLQAAAIRLTESVGYLSAGTVEYIYDVNASTYYFLEVNTRLQVEHGVTEEVVGVDLVEWMIRQAADDLPNLDLPSERPGGHSIQARIYAEDPDKNFQPSSGLLNHVSFPESIRCDHWISSGTEVTSHYDPLLAKLIVHAPTREEAIAELHAALEQTAIYGIETNREYLSALVQSDLLRENKMTTQSLKAFQYETLTIDTLKSGVQTTVQDYPGRVGYWEVGVPPSGPMDSLSFRLGNRLLGNDESAAGLETTLEGPTLRFNAPTTIVLTGAESDAKLNGQALSFWEPIEIASDDVLEMGQVTGIGMRTYLCIAGGLNVADYLGSKSTFTLGKFGGHGGRPLQTGDVLHVNRSSNAIAAKALPAEYRPKISNQWTINVLYGPHGAPDFFTDDDIETFFATEWEVHFNSARTGVRLIGPKPQWARPDGGEAGLHPSNIHDNAYAIGAIDFTGDMPVILGPDGPSLGGFVCPATVAFADLWKIGQLRPGDRIRFECIDQSSAALLVKNQENLVNALRNEETPAVPCITPKATDLILTETGDGNERMVIRQSGDDNVLIEFGPPLLDLRLRFIVHVFYEQLLKNRLEGVIDLTPGIRSLQIHFDRAALELDCVLEWLLAHHADLKSLEEQKVSSRIVHLPLSWDDPSTQLAVSRYMQTVRPDAPWCPNNLEFIRRINGLESVDQVREIVFNASYVVLGLGDVYLGAPVATPLDPRHRLITTKYNPARTWTPENAVGIGGAYMCVYGMEGPGGYQFVGRTLQMWNRYGSVDAFHDDKPWLLRFFDQIRFFPVSADELTQIRKDFPQGRYPIKIEQSSFDLHEYEAMLAKNDADIQAFRSQQREAFDAERGRWSDTDQRSDLDEVAVDSTSDIELPEGSQAIESSVSGTVYKVLVNEGDHVQKGQTTLVLESMKMEISVCSPYAGEVMHVAVANGGFVKPGDRLLAVRSD
ncbi:MAG: urea carboxylase [Verrucomicrobiota bacterium]